MPDEIRDEELEAVSGGYAQNLYYCPCCYRRIIDPPYKKEGESYYRCAKCGKEDISPGDVFRWCRAYTGHNDPEYWPYRPK